MIFYTYTKEFIDVFISLKDYQGDKEQVAKMFDIPSECIIEVPEVST